MKKIIGAGLLLITLVCCLIGFNQKEENSYIRIHIRANSNSDYDQNIKYKVKDKVVEAITPLAQEIKSLEDMYSLLDSNLQNIKAIVDKFLLTQGVTYVSNIRLNKEEFPTRSYEELTLQAGVYDALIIELGSGEGDNWWCVAYPPLCFIGEDTGTEEIIYKSKFKEFFDKIFKK